MLRRSLALAVLSLVGCAASGPEPEAFGTPGCGITKVQATAVATYTTGSSWSEDLQAFEAYEDGHVDVHTLAADRSGNVDREVAMGREGVAALLSDLHSTDVLSAPEGCYASHEATVIDGGGGASFAVRGADRLHLFSVSGPAPSSVEHAQARLARFMGEVAAR